MVLVMYAARSSLIGNSALIVSLLASVVCVVVGSLAMNHELAGGVIPKVFRQAFFRSRAVCTCVFGVFCWFL